VDASRGSRSAALVLGALVALVGIGLLLSGDPVPSRLERGASAPDFELRDLEGREVKLADLRGRVVLVNFWATWCKPCEDEMPAMERLYRSLEPEGFELLAVSVDEGQSEVRAFEQRLGITFPILLDPDQSVSELYQTTGFPESVLVDAQGRIIDRFVGPRDWDAEVYVERIRELLAERG